MSDQIQQNLQSILRWSLNVQGGGNEARESSGTDEEKHQWLKDCLEALSSQPTETDMLKAALAVLSTHYGTTTTTTSQANNKLSDAFDQIQYLVEDLNHAQDLIPLKGVDIIMKYLRHQDSNLQMSACEVIASSTQNLPVCQEAFLPCLTHLLHLLEEGNTEDSLKIKVIYALSGIVRGNEHCVRELLKLDGMSILLKFLSSKHTKIIVKVCYLLQALFHDPIDVLKLEASRIMGCLLGHLLTSDDDEFKILFCTALSSVVASTDSKMLFERADELLPILSNLKDRTEDESAKEAVKDLLMQIEK